ncbi:hypothetical protein [Paraburkholderia adhaesiva]|uniref:hypothetical protein n=1 Tax=Paraburkholderia adhaesiva TaxID=2883244 RepID=UPI001F2B4539|nr:hypothetical protein [Paraburkholderia adhaesiva]
MRLSFLAILSGLALLLAYCVFVRHWNGALAALTIGGVGLALAVLLLGVLLLVAPAASRAAIREVFVATVRDDLRTLRSAAMYWRCPVK